MVDLDPFECLYEPPARKAYLQRQEVKAQTAVQRKLEKEERDRAILFQQWQKWHQERENELYASGHRKAARELADFVQRMTLDDAPALLTLVTRGPWSDSPRDVKFTVLSMISHAIVFLRERNGLEPFDDPLPFSDEDDNVFLLIRDMLR